MAYLGCNVVNIKKEKHYWQITLDREDVHNAFHPEMIEAITKFYKEANEDNEIHCVVMSANGKSFCAGADLGYLKTLQANTYEENLEDSKNLMELFKLIYHLKNQLLLPLFFGFCQESLELALRLCFLICCRV